MATMMNCGKEGAPNGVVVAAAADTESAQKKRTKQETMVRMSQKLPPSSPSVEQSVPSPGEHFDAYEDYEEGADMQVRSSWCKALVSSVSSLRARVTGSASLYEHL